MPLLLLAFAGLAVPAMMLGELAAILRAGPSSQVQQNRRADADDLSRIRNLAMLRRFVAADLLVPVPVSTRYYYLRNVPASQRYIRPWTKLFLDRLSRQYHARFGQKLRVTSLVRTTAFQNSLRRRNRNAAPAYGAKRSTHLTGATLDISKKFMRGSAIAWMRRVLSALKHNDYIYAVEEFRQPTFHIMVHKNYPEYVEQLEARNGG